MNEQTEKLGDEFYNILVACGVKVNKGFITERLLQACKEAGLKFVEYPCVDEDNSQPDTTIKEIEL